MFRTIFTVFLAYFVYKIARVIIDPMFDAPKQNNMNNQPRNAQQPQAKPETPKAGEYIEYEEIK